MNTRTAIEQIADSIKNVCHSKIGRYFVTCRNGCFVLLAQEEHRSGEDELGTFTSLDLTCGLSLSQWYRLKDAIDEYLGDNE